MDEPEEDLLDKILGDDKDLVEDGVDVNIWLEVEEVSNVGEVEKTAIDNQRGDYDVAVLLDVSMFMQIGTNPAQKLTEIAKPVTVVVPISDELLMDYEHREYKVIRVHNGIAEEISATVDPVAKTLTFTTDRFSTYAIAYKSPAGNGGGTGNTGNSGTSSDKTNRTGTENPATGDTTDLEKYLYMMLLSGAALVSLLAMKRRKQNW